MGTKARSFTLATAAVSAVLLFGAPADKADARERAPRRTDTRRHDGGNGELRRRSVERGRTFGRRFDNRSFGGRFSGRFVGRPSFRPFRTVRVFVYEPFPHWILRRIYDDATVVVGPDCSPY